MTNFGKKFTITIVCHKLVVDNEIIKWLTDLNHLQDDWSKSDFFLSEGLDS